MNEFPLILLNQSLKWKICMNRFWRPFFMEMEICSITTRNCRTLWFGFTFTPTSRNSTKSNAGAHSRKLQHLPVGSIRKRFYQTHQAIGNYYQSHAKKIVNVAFHHLAWSHGHKSFLIQVNLVLGPKSKRAFGKKPERAKEDVSVCDPLRYISKCVKLVLQSLQRKYKTIYYVRALSKNILSISFPENPMKDRRLGLDLLDFPVSSFLDVTKGHVSML